MKLSTRVITFCSCLFWAMGAIAGSGDYVTQVTIRDATGSTKTTLRITNANMCDRRRRGIVAEMRQIDGLELMMLLLKKRTICIPRYFRKSMDQHVILVKEYMRDNPPKDNGDAELIVFSALAKAFVDNHSRMPFSFGDYLLKRLNIGASDGD